MEASELNIAEVGILQNQCVHRGTKGICSASNHGYGRRVNISLSRNYPTQFVCIA